MTAVVGEEEASLGWMLKHRAVRKYHDGGFLGVRSRDFGEFSSAL